MAYNTRIQSSRRPRILSLEKATSPLTVVLKARRGFYFLGTTEKKLK